MDAKHEAIRNYYRINGIKIINAKKMIETQDTNYFDLVRINEKPTDNNTISIVMTSNNRSKQTYFTITMIGNSLCKNILVIVVDDSTHDPIKVDELKKIGVHIILITVKNKFWINPCINYNLGFKFVKGNKVVIQNAEVCHIADVLKHVETYLTDDMYMVFDVLSLATDRLHPSESFKFNDKIQQESKLDYDYIREIVKMPCYWYQHHSILNRRYHFLVAMSSTTLNKIGGFDLDYAIGTSWDDDDFIFKIFDINKMMLRNVPSESHRVLGFHQHHNRTLTGYDIFNKILYEQKKEYYWKFNVDLRISNFDKHNQEVVMAVDSLFLKLPLGTISRPEDNVAKSKTDALENNIIKSKSTENSIIGVYWYSGVHETQIFEKEFDDGKCSRNSIMWKLAGEYRKKLLNKNISK